MTWPLPKLAAAEVPVLVAGAATEVPTLLFPPLPVLLVLQMKAKSAPGRNLIQSGQRNKKTLDPKAPSWEELPEQHIYVLVGNPRTPSPRRGTAGMQIKGYSYRRSPQNFGPIGCGYDICGYDCPSTVVDNRVGHPRSDSNLPGQDCSRVSLFAEYVNPRQAPRVYMWPPGPHKTLLERDGNSFPGWDLAIRTQRTPEPTSFCIGSGMP
ncbi:hypothetical protein TIFTF001_008942 [Ficus carica]|uniref:Uncharacterized protein n=1 Tax=Ficus carica TaxID=3494 RepID=A0AA88D396_FICCA|nr:hypothetical protein TIFTF001_008942 [Ficus carica]